MLWRCALLLGLPYLQIRPAPGRWPNRDLGCVIESVDERQDTTRLGLHATPVSEFRVGLGFPNGIGRKLFLVNAADTVKSAHG